MFKWLDFKITNRCNNHCVYCGVPQAPEDAPESLGTGVVARAVDDAIKAGFTHLAFLGGEPTLRADYPACLAPLQAPPQPGGNPGADRGGDPGVRPPGKPLVDTVMVITNCLAYNEALYRAIFDARATRAQVVCSIDTFRGPNCKHQDPATITHHLARLQDLAREYETRGVPNREVAVHAVISRENYDHVARHVRECAARGLDVSLALVEPFELADARAGEGLTGGNSGPGEDKGRVNHPTCGNDARGRRELERHKITPPPRALRYNQFRRADVRAVLAELDALAAEGALNWANQVLKRYLEDFVLGERHTYQNCTAGRHHVVIDADGAVYPCLTEAYRRGLQFGNIRDQRFRDIYARMATFECTAPFQQTCWDHYLWTELDRHIHRHGDHHLNERLDRHLDRHLDHHLDFSRGGEISRRKASRERETPLLGPAGPTRLVLELSRQCNLDCVMCGYRRSIPRPAGQPAFMASPVLDQVLQETSLGRALTEVRLNGRGESTLHPDFPRLVEHVARTYPRAHLTLFTNLMFPDDALLDQFRAQGVSTFVSVDGGRADTYETIRRGGRWATLVRRLDHLDRIGHAGLTHLVFTLQPRNFGELAEAGELAARYGCGFILNVVRSDAAAFRREFKKLLARRWAELEDELAALHGLIPGGRLLVPDQIWGRPVAARWATAESCGRLPRCPNATGEMMVATDGRVYPCNMFHPHEIGRLEIPGTPARAGAAASLLAIWRGPRRQRFLRNHKTTPYCQNCEYMVSTGPRGREPQ